MAHIAMRRRSVFILLVLVTTISALTMDEDATNNLISAANSGHETGEVAIVVRGPHGRSARREELLHVKGAEDDAISLYYNKKSNKVSLESLNGGFLRSVSWSLGSFSKSTLVLVTTASRVKLVVGCNALHWHPMAGKHNMIALFSNMRLKLYHEENAPVEFYSSERAALNSLGCNIQDGLIKPPALLTVDDEESDVEEVKDFKAKEARRKREQMLGDDYRTDNNYIDGSRATQPESQRGDIPSGVIETCDDEVVRQLQMLRQTIDHLRNEIAAQKGTIDNLRGQLRQCCNNQPRVETCTGSTCYDGY